MTTDLRFTEDGILLREDGTLAFGDECCDCANSNQYDCPYSECGRWPWFYMTPEEIEEDPVSANRRMPKTLQYSITSNLCYQNKTGTLTILDPLDPADNNLDSGGLYIDLDVYTQIKNAIDPSITFGHGASCKRSWAGAASAYGGQWSFPPFQILTQNIYGWPWGNASLPSYIAPGYAEYVPEDLGWILSAGVYRDCSTYPPLDATECDKQRGRGFIGSLQFVAWYRGRNQLHPQGDYNDQQYAEMCHWDAMSSVLWYPNEWPDSGNPDLGACDAYKYYSLLKGSCKPFSASKGIKLYHPAGNWPLWNVPYPPTENIGVCYENVNWPVRQEAPPLWAGTATVSAWEVA